RQDDNGRCDQAEFAGFLHARTSRRTYGTVDERHARKVAESYAVMWILRTIPDGEPEKTFRLLAGGIRTVGRATGADFIVDAPLVSRVHCRLTGLSGGDLAVREV